MFVEVTGEKLAGGYLLPHRINGILQIFEYFLRKLQFFKIIDEFRLCI